MSAQQFTFSVDGIGAFSFRHRNMRLQFAIEAEYSRLTEGVAMPTAFLAGFASAIAELKVLTVEAPEGWDIDAMDPSDPEVFLRLSTVSDALREKEKFFRTGGGPKRAAGGEGGG